MSLSAWQAPEEGQHSPGTGGKSLSQKPLGFLLIQSPGQNAPRERFGSPGASRAPRVRGSSAI